MMKKNIICLLFIVLLLAACESEKTLEDKVTMVDKDLRNFIYSDLTVDDFIENCPLIVGDNLKTNLMQKYIVDNSPFIYVTSDSPLPVSLGKYEQMSSEEKLTLKEQMKANETVIYGKMNYLPVEVSELMQFTPADARYAVFVRQTIEVDKISIEDTPNYSIEKPLSLVVTRAYIFEKVDDNYVWVDFDLKTALK